MLSRAAPFDGIASAPLNVCFQPLAQSIRSTAERRPLRSLAADAGGLRGAARELVAVTHCADRTKRGQSWRYGPKFATMPK